MDTAKTNIVQLMTTDDTNWFFKRKIENKITTTLKKKQNTISYVT